jgi:hypothetical protein
MAKLKIELEGDDVIDNASIYLEDPLESIEYKLKAASDTKFELNITLPVEGALDYSLHVVAFSGTHFNCVITDVDSEKTIKIEGITGRLIKNRAKVTGSQNFK